MFVVSGEENDIFLCAYMVHTDTLIDFSQSWSCLFKTRYCFCCYCEL